MHIAILFKISSIWNFKKCGHFLCLFINSQLFIYKLFQRNEMIFILYGNDMIGFILWDNFYNVSYLNYLVSANDFKKIFCSFTYYILIIRCVRRFESHINRAHKVGLAFSPCSRYIAVGSENRSVGFFFLLWYCRFIVYFINCYST